MISLAVPGELRTGKKWSRWGPSWSVTSVELFTQEARDSGPLLDEELYLGTLQGVIAGRGFYRAQNDMFNRNPGRWNTRSPLTYRQPLLTQVWARLRHGAMITMAWSLLAAASVVAAYLAAARFVSPRIALLAPFGLSVVYSLLVVHPPRLLYTEAWAGPLLVAAAALCGGTVHAIRSRSVGPRAAWALSAGGAGCALAALLVRELAFVAVAWMLLALLLDRGTRARWLFAPWAISVGLWIAAYAWHARMVARVAADDPSPPQSQGSLLASYLHPGIDFIAACVRWMGTTPAIALMLTVLCAMAAVSPFRIPGAAQRVLVGGLTWGSLLLLVVSGTPGIFPDGSYTGYWGFLFIPVVLAWTPLALYSHPRRTDQRRRSP